MCSNTGNMLISTVFILSMFLEVNGAVEDGFDSRCEFNSTLFVQRGKVATFYVTDDWDYNLIRFYRGITKSTYLLYARVYPPDKFRYSIITDRLNATFMDSETINITLRDVVMDDRGMYMARGLSTTCWELFVLDIWNTQAIHIFEEFRPAYIHASPPASRMVRPRVNATATWLLDGLNYSQTSDFLEQDGQILIVSVLRNLDGKNVTYKIVEDNGNLQEVNQTLSVTYGPDTMLQLSPAQTFYTMTNGDVLPDIKCSTECNPKCQMTWDRLGVGNVLRVGKVDISSNGMYTCRATRKGSDVVVERSIYVEVSEWHIIISPDYTVYYLSAGETLPDIACTAECNSLCNVRWNSHSSTSVLSLGTVTSDMSGEYTCIASREDSDKMVKRSVIINVKDNTSFIVAAAVLGTIQGMTLICLGVCAVYMYRASGRNLACMTCTGIKKRKIHKTHENMAKQNVYNQDISTIEMEHYEGLENTQSGTNENYENLNIANVANPL